MKIRTQKLIIDNSSLYFQSILDIENNNDKSLNLRILFFIYCERRLKYNITIYISSNKHAFVSVE